MALISRVILPLSFVVLIPHPSQPSHPCPPTSVRHQESARQAFLAPAARSLARTRRRNPPGTNDLSSVASVASSRIVRAHSVLCPFVPLLSHRHRPDQPVSSTRPDLPVTTTSNCLDSTNCGDNPTNTKPNARPTSRADPHRPRRGTRSVCDQARRSPHRKCWLPGRLRLFRSSFLRVGFGFPSAHRESCVLQHRDHRSVLQAEHWSGSDGRAVILADKRRATATQLAL
jgi:hypothetical protein